MKEYIKLECIRNYFYDHNIVFKISPDVKALDLVRDFADFMRAVGYHEKSIGNALVQTGEDINEGYEAVED